MDLYVVAKQNAMAKTISMTMAATLTNHIMVFIRSLTNVMKEVIYGAPIHHIGPAYFNQMISKKQVDTQAMVGEQARNSSQGGSTSQLRDTTHNM
jgi:hypothetical protein